MLTYERFSKPFIVPLGLLKNYPISRDSDPLLPEHYYYNLFPLPLVSTKNNPHLLVTIYAGTERITEAHVTRTIISILLSNIILPRMTNDERDA